MNVSRVLCTSLVAALLLVASMGLMTVGSSQPIRALEGNLRGNVGVVSDYFFRGSNEQNGASVQGGFDYSHPSGFYAGYWGSPVDFGASEGPSGQGDAFENDFYAGYTNSLGNVVTYDIGLYQYLYANQDDGPDGEGSNATEGYLGFSKGPFSLTGNFSFTDADWTRSGDIYVSGTYSTDLAYGFGFSAKAGWYDYDSALDGSDPKEDGSFRDAVFTLSHPIGETGADMTLQYVQTGDARDGLNVNGPNGDDQQVIIGISYGFDVAKGMGM